ncbi:MAG: hypothetical protein HN350_18745 [Phycisphaerales bacterium]|jgi:hypothetical protein|nr:hypothetical protein [Phycisphaerales bacterium]
MSIRAKLTLEFLGVMLLAVVVGYYSVNVGESASQTSLNVTVLCVFLGIVPFAIALNSSISRSAWGSLRKLTNVVIYARRRPQASRRQLLQEIAERKVAEQHLMEANVRLRRQVSMARSAALEAQTANAALKKAAIGRRKRQLGRTFGWRHPLRAHQESQNA